MLRVIKVECLITGGCVQSIGKMCEMVKNSKKESKKTIQKFPKIYDTRQPIFKDSNTTC